MGEERRLLFFMWCFSYSIVHINKDSEFGRKALDIRENKRTWKLLLKVHRFLIWFEGHNYSTGKFQLFLIFPFLVVKHSGTLSPSCPKNKRWFKVLISPTLCLVNGHWAYTIGICTMPWMTKISDETELWFMRNLIFELYWIILGWNKTEEKLYQNISVQLCLSQVFVWSARCWGVFSVFFPFFIITWLWLNKDAR